jgi:hypothetical protein
MPVVEAKSRCRLYDECPLYMYHTIKINSEREKVPLVDFDAA